MVALKIMKLLMKVEEIVDRGGIWMVTNYGSGSYLPKSTPDQHSTGGESDIGEIMNILSLPTQP